MAQKGQSVRSPRAGGTDWLWTQRKHRRERLEGKAPGRFRHSEEAFSGSRRRQWRQEGKDGEEGEGDQGQTQSLRSRSG